VRLVFGLFIFLLLLPVALAELEGCYIYPGADASLLCADNILESEAQADCDANGCEDLDLYFYPGVSCNTLDQCEEIMCSVTCDIAPKVIVIITVV